MTPNDSGALASLDISSNRLAQREWDDDEEEYKTDMTGVIALAEALKIYTSIECQ